MNNSPNTNVASNIPTNIFFLPYRIPRLAIPTVTVLASKQQDLIEVATQAKAGKIAIDGPYGATMTSLREITY